MNIDLSGQVVVITGAGRGIGREMALTFAKNNAIVILAARSLDQIKQVANEITDAGGKAVPVETDITNTDAVANLIKVAIDQTGRIDILINNAGTSYVANIVMSNDEKWQEVINVNLMGVYNCTKAALRHMIMAKAGRIVNISSVAGLTGAAFNSAYAASKAAVIGFTKSTALEVAKAGITANAICPWHLDTDLAQSTMAARGKMFGKSAEQYLEQLASDSPQERLITTEEIAGLALFLVSPQARGITGQAINVSGGAVI